MNRDRSTTGDNQGGQEGGSRPMSEEMADGDARFFDLSLDLLCIAGTDGYFKRINPAFARVLGYPEEELLSRPFLSFVHAEDVEATVREIQRLDHGLPTVLFENRYLAMDGTVRWFQWNASAPAANGRIYAVARDVTALKEAEAALRHYAAELEKSNRRLRSTQEQLIQAEKMESVGRLAAGVAHEVRNPLALLLLGVDYLSTGVVQGDTNVPTILREMREAISRADRIVRGLVNFSGDNRPSLAAVEFRPLLEDVLLMMRHELTRASVRVDVRVQRDLPSIWADKGRIEQVLVNLITNAIQAMEKTTQPRLRIRARLKTLDDVARDEGARTFDHLRLGDEAVVIEVIDNGPGIPSRAASKLFDPFFTTKPTGVGTGLGLTVVRRIVDLHQGRIELRNDPETGGARATLTLRVASEEEPR
jgi:PAS domain S-box-containing protein